MNIPKILAVLLALSRGVAWADSDQVLEQLDAQRMAIESQRSDIAKAIDEKERAC